MLKEKFSITEIACKIHDLHPYSSNRLETKFAIPRIIEALLGKAASGELRVSFTGDVSDEFEDWFAYWAYRIDKADDEGNISDQEIYDLGDTMIVFQDDWSIFENGSVFREWIRDNAPLTEERVQSYWLGSLKAKPGGLTTEDRRRGGRQPKFDLSLLEAIRRVIVDVTEDGISPSTRQVWVRLCELGEEGNGCVFEPLIPGFDLMYVEGNTLHFQDQPGNPKKRERRSLDRYVTEAKKILAQAE